MIYIFVLLLLLLLLIVQNGIALVIVNGVNCKNIIYIINETIMHICHLFFIYIYIYIKC